MRGAIGVLLLLGGVLALPAPEPADPEPSIQIYNPATDPEEQARKQSATKCTIFQERIPNTMGKGDSMWVKTDPEVGNNQCLDVCGDAIAKQRKEHPDEASGAECWAFNPQWVQYDNDPNKQIAQANCTCNDPLTNMLAVEFVEALPAIAEIGCNLIMTSLQYVAEAGALAIPGVGEAIDGGMIAGVTSAKLASYAYDSANGASQAFNTWAKPCGEGKDMPADMQKVFDTLNSASPLILPKGSFFNPTKPKFTKGGKKDGGDPPPKEPKPTPKPSDKPSDKSSEKPNPTEKKPSTTPPTTTSKPGQCTRKNGKRGNDKSKSHKCADETITHYVIDKSVSDKKLNVITKTCDYNLWPEACAHYYLAIHERNALSQFICEDDEARVSAPATNSWTTQHNSGKGWGDYTMPSYQFRGQKKAPDCQADEWPPGYFLPNSKDDRKEKKEFGQIIRWIPGSENGGVASLWRNFCRSNDGGHRNSQRMSTANLNNKEDDLTIELKSDLLKTDKPKTSSSSKDGTMTITHNYGTVTYTRAAFELAFNYEKIPAGNGGKLKPSKENDWLLPNNPCWPSAIVPDDPGFVLLTNDPWYTSHKFPNEDYTLTMLPKYAHAPAKDLVDAAERRKADVGQKRPPSPQELNPNPPNVPKTKNNNKRLALITQGLVLRDDLTNNTRRLEEDEILNNVVVTGCADRTCSKERRELELDGEDGALVIPGELPAPTPSANVEAVVTVAAKAMTLVRRVEKRKTPSDQMAAATPTFHPHRVVGNQP